MTSVHRGGPPDVKTHNGEGRSSESEPAYLEPAYLEAAGLDKGHGGQMISLGTIEAVHASLCGCACNYLCIDC